MVDVPTAYPLKWPLAKPRTPENERLYGRFGYKSRQSWGMSNSDLTIAMAYSRVQEELGMFTRRGHPDRIDWDATVVSTNLKLRMDGAPRSDQRKPEDPGAVLYYDLDGDQQVIAVDRYNKVEQNLAAIASILQCLRTMERHDASVMKMAMVGIRGELPSPETVGTPHWTQLFNVPATADYKQVKMAYKQTRGKYHPDRPSTGDVRMFDLCNKAWDQYCLQNRIA